MLGNSKMFDELYASVNTESFAPRVLSMMQSVRQSFLVLMEKRFDNNLDNDLLWISLLDPYMTNTGLFTAGEFNQAKMRMIAEMCRVKRAAVGASCESQQPSFQSPEKILKSAKDRAQRSFQQLMYAGRMKRQAVETREDKIEADCEWELGNYIKLSAEAEVKKNATKPPSSLAWWKLHYKEFPTIAPLARKWLGCIATSVPSERAFSTAGNTITKRRSALKSSTVRDVIFMAQNT